jgi:hypothetical protein
MTLPELSGIIMLNSYSSTVFQLKLIPEDVGGLLIEAKAKSGRNRGKGGGVN